MIVGSEQFGMDLESNESEEMDYGDMEDMDMIGGFGQNPNINDGISDAFEQDGMQAH